MGWKKLLTTNGVSFRPGYRAAPLLTAGHLKQSVLKGVSSLFHITQIITNDVSLGNQWVNSIGSLLPDVRLVSASWFYANRRLLVTREVRRLKIKVRGSRPLQQLEIGHAGLDAERLLVELYSLWSKKQKAHACEWKFGSWWVFWGVGSKTNAGLTWWVGSMPH